jgi:hypothetical protein
MTGCFEHADETWALQEIGNVFDQLTEVCFFNKSVHGIQILFKFW